MLGPLVVLAGLSIVGGYLFNVPKTLENMFPAAEGAEDMTLTYISVLFGLVGLGLSYYMYVMNTGVPQRITAALGGLYTLVYNKYFVDEIYDAAVVNPVIEGSSTVLWRGVDQGLIDGAVNGVGSQSQSIGGILRRLQSGNIRSYATWIVIGAVLLLLVMGLTAVGFAGAAEVAR
jgi:NADH-quinone oxidoreductase subunit L